VTEDSTLGLPIPADSPGQASSPGTQLVTRIFLVALGALLLGYMFLGRGFAHIGIGPIYVGDGVLLLGVVAAALLVIRARLRPPITWTVALLLAFAALGALRTFPFLGTYGLNALRDGTMWGYAGFALIVYLLADRWLLLGTFRLYGRVVPIFALWLPISWNLFAAASADMDPSRPGSLVPLVFFKGGDMAVHVVGAIAFLVLGAAGVKSARTFVWRMLIGLPLLWTAFIAGTANRGALVTATAGIAIVVMLAPRSRNWLPILAAAALFAIAGLFQAVLVAPGELSPVASVEPTPIPSPSVLTVTNPGFELGPINNGTIEGWTVGGAGSHDIVAGSAYKGAHSASVQNVAKAYEDTITSSTFLIEAGTDIAVSVAIRAIVARPIVEIYVNWYDYAGTLISGDPVKRCPTEGVRSWQDCAGARPVPAKTTHAEIILYEAQGRATVGIDEVTVRSGHFIAELVPLKGRSATLQQLIDNLLSVFGSSSDRNLEGTKQFRLAWWGKIVDYTVFGKYFWTGKGFGVNLADSDGFQTNADDSLRSPHNSEMTVLARMGVPGLLLWVLLQGAFGIGILRATLAHRRAGDLQIAAVGAWILAYWVAMMVNTSFDPYLEGPQGGIWFWVIFGLGLVVMRQVPRHRVAA
jgi:hypothetical protein